ncbi:hypothetical protein ZWY2020_046787 [Hordeum vulgare]|nr:hypothetical protein ZWY2020_046787 [Hordeum vulgare]
MVDLASSGSCTATARSALVGRRRRALWWQGDARGMVALRCRARGEAEAQWEEAALRLDSAGPGPCCCCSDPGPSWAPCTGSPVHAGCVPGLSGKGAQAPEGI